MSTLRFLWRKRHIPDIARCSNSDRLGVPLSERLRCCFGRDLNMDDLSAMPFNPTSSVSYVQFMMYIKIIIGSNLVSIFLRILASASMRCSIVMAATSGGATSLPLEVAGPASRLEGAISSLDKRSVVALWSRFAEVAMLGNCDVREKL